MSMLNKGITSPLSIVELPTKLTEVKGAFTYLNYDKNERLSTEHVLVSIEEDEDGNPVTTDVIPTNDGQEYPDRWITIKIKPEDNYTSLPSDVNSNEYIEKSQIFSELEQSNIDLSQLYKPDEDKYPNVFFAQDFITGFIRVVPNSALNVVSFQKASQAAADTSKSVRTALDYLKNNIEATGYTSDLNVEDYEKGIRNSNLTEVLILDPNTNLPLTKTDVDPVSSGQDSYISASYANKIFRKSKSSPMVWNITDRMVNLSSLIADQNEDLKLQRKLSNMYHLLMDLNTKSEMTAGVNLEEKDNTIKDIDFYHVGWHVIKYVKNGNDLSFISSFAVSANSFQEVHEDYPGSTDVDPDTAENYFTFKDPYVLYGNTYRYEVRDLWAAIIKGDNSGGVGTRTAYFISGTQTAPIEVECREKLPPLCPSSFSFEYVGDNYIRVSWIKTKRLVLLDHPWTAGTEINSEGVETTISAPPEFEADDLGGYLLFVRNSLSKPYEIYGQLHRRDGVYIGPEISTDVVGFSVPNDKIQFISSEENQHFDLEVRSNQDYYVTVCSYDVHGNISNYSEQFYLRRNNVTGEVSTQLVSSKGASLAYPNSMMPNNFVLSSMKSSGYKYMEVYQTPDVPNAKPTRNGGITIQLIDLETEADAIIQGVASTN